MSRVGSVAHICAVPSFSLLVPSYCLVFDSLLVPKVEKKKHARVKSSCQAWL